ncbi:M24 family metallopeptidase [Rhodoligotrophos defluvii]|uniref:M24 family metallopeptidase n=1 Tax=Rhodoligotrophos defluvii TaxID=2561934 RepID=UPI001485B68C|nr:Xaa-Pro peptidase family protein [Rhodoligotrophos defluvii]
MANTSDYNGLAPGAFEALSDTATELAFDRSEYLDRIRRVRALMAEAKIDVLYVTTPDHVAWLHGYYASWYKANAPMRYPQLYGSVIHVDHDDFIHFDNPTELPVLAKCSISTDNRFFKSREASVNLPFIMGELKAKGWLNGTVGMEYWSYVPNRAISTMLEGAFLAEGTRVVDASAILRRARRVKSPAEIATIEQATRFAEIGIETIRRELRPGMTELELFGLTTAAMMKAGSEFPALIPIFNAVPVRDGRPVSSGHSMAGRKVIQAGEFLTADLCGVHNRYHSNIMRGFLLGEPTRDMLDMYGKAAGVFDLFRNEVKAGMTVREVNTLIRRYLAEVGLLDGAGWVLGYELGLSLPPDWVGDFYFHYQDDKYLDRVFEENMVTNLESLFNTWLIDTLVYEKDGARVLSKVPLELIVV